MTSTSAVRPPLNPFSSRFVRPGAVPFLFPTGISAADVIARLESKDWQGQVSGPHGTGKSTLIAALIPELIAAGREPLWYTFRDGFISLPGYSEKSLGLHSTAILIIDGYEQLSPWRRWSLSRVCRRVGCGLLVTAHEPVGLPDVYRTAVDAELAQRVLAHLNCDETAFVGDDDLNQCLTARTGNLREALFDLYDLHERRVRGNQNVGWAPCPSMGRVLVLQNEASRPDVSPRSGVPDLATPDGRGGHPTSTAHVERQSTFKRH